MASTSTGLVKPIESSKPKEPNISDQPDMVDKSSKSSMPDKPNKDSAVTECPEVTTNTEDESKQGLKKKDSSKPITMGDKSVETKVKSKSKTEPKRKWYGKFGKKRTVALCWSVGKWAQDQLRKETPKPMFRRVEILSEGDVMIPKPGSDATDSDGKPVMIRRPLIPVHLRQMIDRLHRRYAFSKEGAGFGAAPHVLTTRSVDDKFPESDDAALLADEVIDEYLDFTGRSRTLIHLSKHTRATLPAGFEPSFNRHYTRAQVLHEGVWYPAEESSEANITVFQASRQDETLSANATLELNFPMSDEQERMRGYKNLKVSKVYKERKTSAKRWIEVEFDTVPEGTFPSGLDFIEGHGWRDSTIALLNIMRGWRNPSHIQLHFISTLGGKEKDEESLKIVDLANEMKRTGIKRPFYPYYSAEGRALVEKSQQKPHQRVDEDHPIGKVGPLDHFRSADHAAIVLGYSTDLQNNYEQERYIGFDSSHVFRVAYRIISDKHVLGFCQADFKGTALDLELLKCMPTTDSFEIQFKVQTSNIDRTYRATGITVPAIYPRGFTFAFLCLRIPEKVAEYSSVGSDGPLKFWPTTKVMVNTSSRVAVTKIASMYKLSREPVYKHLIPVLNMNPEKWEMIDPTACNTGLNDFDRKYLMNRILSQGEINGRPFTTQQQRKISSATQLGGGVMLIGGPGGSGKTATQIALMKYYSLCGLKSIAVCPTNISTSHLRKEHDKAFTFIAAKDPDVRAMQVAPPNKEQAHFNCAGMPKTPHVLQDLELHGLDISAVATEEGDINSLFDAIKDRRRTRSFKHPEHGLSSRIIEAVRSKPRPFELKGKYPPAKRMLPHIDKDLREELWGPNPIVTDGFASLNQMEVKKYKFLYKELSHEITARANVVFSTMDNVTCSPISSSFGRGARGVMLFLDECTMADEPAVWSLYTSIFSPERIRDEFGGVHPIKGIVMSGDFRQNWPLVTGAEYNEFHPQLMTPLIARFVNSGVPYDEFKTEATESKFRQLLALEKPMSDRQFNMLRKYLGGKKDLPLPSRDPSGRTDIAARKIWLDWSMHAWLLDVPASKCYVGPNHSQVNFANVAATMLFLEDMFIKTADGKPFIPFNDVVIVSPYAEQIIEYQKEKVNLARRLGCNSEDLPEAITGDAFHSRDARMVIFDIVVSSTKTKSDLGFLESDRRMTVLLQI
ncbi:hypothetical protein EPUS_09343 [Endocarpon pusillum Z07020]|uniref:DNA2/NAM7 helicase-like C-terminal domain-containing protein n=1 Tax=Endocarpon pusillum (strain Z07020 / HMAS-L-300199) TaxID=1263415 RepID=U1HK71_ENDPU|nr:uncharacterized protein EPUS_09343 [Endocarpon pusillum Z07020]ERF69339.1 hypothetical protein EPUS_09343 [Endocarpon pusillum Z07020]